MSSRIRLVFSVLAALTTALIGVGLAAGPASAAPGDPLSFHVDGSEFVAQTGTAVTQVVRLTNDGTDPLVFPAPPTFIAPLHLDSWTGMTGETILPGAAATLTLTYTAGAPGRTGESVFFTMTAVDGSHVQNASLHIGLESTSTSPLHFTLDPVTLDFGAVTVGASATKTLTVSNDGSVPLYLCTADVMFYDIVGTELPNFQVTSSSLGASCGYVPADEQATFGVTFAPLAKTDAFRGLVAVTARYIPGEDVADTLTVDGVIAAAALDPVVVPTPTPTPTTAAPATPAVKPAASAAAAATTPQLAHTGAGPAFAVGFGTLTLALGGVALSIARSARRKARRG
ncbi:MAG: choice-of-anchor D domain-containing protein [Herbiconiux sp.]|uniref:choice-of-anchor D domain-containing protein n=1 Tax=Herbiconiux sp. TaxID=1871186 RepID=UPI00120F9BF1|nr:choice-of-anchor D domain-containing protein [Herbiconiux sp.]TAJ48317.1 MAG: choice-of-anchor D domain-containing protein [Herbiconiux sp.]